MSRRLVLASFAVGLIILVISAVALGFWIDYTLHAEKRVNVAMEDVAQSYAAMPWSLNQINADIDSYVASGEWSQSTGNWIKSRVREIRSGG